ncbi:glycosyltransferase family 4 protein [Methanospirillum purgamenti]|uniref:Glycosyltransferase family 4 protein n=1 Tax=Methanospirillum hungatei TaxID=2203 RepID=A0A8F5VIF1_METHU|nr:glycosyltransferase family 4 protein [Methanospirillum hungatei]QXO93557.1 glycosyltransferase family 4 protein [Methanospirillum hungatei]
MKILFPLAQADSGSDVFTYNLVSGLNNSSIQADIQNLPRWSGYVPSFMGKICKSAGYDIIHANTWNGYPFKNNNQPLLVTEHLLVHDPIFLPYKTSLQRLYHSYIFQWEKKSINVADSVISISNYTKNKIEEVFGYSDSILIYNGIDENFFKPFDVENQRIDSNIVVPSKNTILFFSGNATIRKGGDLLPKIMNELGDKYSLLISGGLRKNTHLNAPNIISTGKLSLHELVEIYNYADIFLFPTRLEGFGLSVAEAMACGKPVVTTDCSSMPELVVDGKGGFLCEMDNVKDFAESIRILAEDSSLRREMGLFNRNRVEKKFTLDRMVQEYIREYKYL